MSKNKRFKTSALDFDFFRREAGYWVGRLGLVNWDVSILHEDHPDFKNDAFAWFRLRSAARQADIGLALRVNAEPTQRMLSFAAFHEAGHILLGNIYFISAVLETLYSGHKAEMETAEHEAIHRLARALWEPHWRGIKKDEK